MCVCLCQCSVRGQGSGPAGVACDRDDSVQSFCEPELRRSCDAPHFPDVPPSAGLTGAEHAGHHRDLTADA